MSDIIKMIHPSLIKNDNIGLDVFGNRIVRDLRSAGDNAQESGARFENQTIDVINFCNKGTFQLQRTPKHRCHFGLKRKGDFEIVSAKRCIHIECKQLGDVQSHLDKISHCHMNVINGCYGNEFWLIYDFNREKQNRTKINAMINESQRIKKQVALQGITFESILIDDLPKYLNQI